MNDLEALEIFEALLDLCVTKEAEIAQLSARLEKAEAALAKSSAGNACGTEKKGKAPTKRGILVADSSEIMRRNLVNLLTSKGYRIAGEADNGKDAVELFMKTKPALVTMDVEMKTMDGCEATREIKKYDPDAKVIIISQVLDREMIVRAIRAGANDFLVKPIRIGRLMEIVEREIP
jgi:two-component system chemotaxis response regulator CheY